MKNKHENLNSKKDLIYAMAKRIFSSYAAILFSENPSIGLLFLLATFWFPNIGASGLIAVLMAVAIANVFKFRNLNSDIHIYNSLLVGLSLGASYQLDALLFGLLFLASANTVFCCVILSEWLWRTERLPALSLPFVVVAFINTFATQGYAQLHHYSHAAGSYESFLTVPVDYFLTALAGIFFTPVPAVGLLLFSGILITSRYLAWLAVCGFLVGNLSYGLLSGYGYSLLSVNSGFNFILTAMAVGGIFTIPSWQSFIVAMLGAALSALIAAALQNILLPYGVSILVLPFLITTWILLAGLNKRSVIAAPYLLLDNPALPEISMERARLAKVRGLTHNVLTLAVPFIGEWRVYQGMEGEHTHQAPWQHALDFIMTDEYGKSYQTSGEFLEDYYCFGLPVLSPVYGQVSSCVGYLPDHPVGEVDTQNNWGNYVLIWVDYQHYVLVAHLQQHSVQVNIGDWVVVGQKIAQCGNTGRSPQPHIHLHVQESPYLGSPTVEFLLAYFVLKTKNATRQFCLTGLPKKNELLSSLSIDSKLAHALHLPVGKQLCYRFSKNAETEQRRYFTVVLTLSGEFRLQADSGASVAFVKTDKLLAFYDRNPIADLCLDLWLLNLGFTPLVNGGALAWQDQPAVSLLPLPALQKSLYRLLPFGHRLQCDYQRQWQDQLDGWRQTAAQTYRCYWHKKQIFQSEAVILPELGCVKMRLQMQGDLFEAQLEACGKAADIGVPGKNTLTTEMELA